MKHLFRLALLLALPLVISGCAVPVIGALTLGDLATGLSLTSTVLTGKGTTEHGLDLLTGKDCRFFDGAVRQDRDFCEEPGAPATADDFQGVAAWAERVNADEMQRRVAAIRVGGAQAGAEEIRRYWFEDLF